MSDSIQVQALQNRTRELENRNKELENRIKELEEQKNREKDKDKNEDKNNKIEADKLKVERLVGGAYRVIVDGKITDWRNGNDVTKIALGQDGRMLLIGNPDIGWVVGRSVTCQEDRV